MAQTGNGSSMYIKAAASIPPLSTFSCHFWYRNAAIPASVVIDIPFSMDAAGLDYAFRFAWDHTTGVTARPAFSLREAGGTTRRCVYVSALAADTWHGLGCTYDGTNIRVYLNGTLDATLACAVPSTLFNIIPAALASNQGASDFDDGTIAEIGVWSVPLDAGEMLALGKTASPILVRPGLLVLYWPLVREVFDAWKGASLTSVAPTVADHPPMIYPSQGQVWPGTATNTMAFSKSISQGVALASDTGPDRLNSTATFTTTLTPKDSFQSISHGVHFAQRLQGNTGYLATGRVSARAAKRER